MDYLNLQKERRKNIMLFLGYGTIAIAIAMTTLVLVYQAYGFGIAKQGQVIQSGLVFFSSQPNPATLKLNGKVNKASTNARLTLPEGNYRAEIAREGYQSWKRDVQVLGGSVHHYDYPLLVPANLATKKLADFEKAPTLTSQSLDRRWLVVQKASDDTTFSVFDLKSLLKDEVQVTLPESSYTKPTATQSWTALEWADDNDHLLLQHNYDDKIEYVLLDRTNPDQSRNITTAIPGDYNRITLLNRKYDRYYLYTDQTKVLQAATLDAPTLVPVLEKVLNFKQYSDDTILYATDTDAPTGKVLIKLKVGQKTYLLKTLPAGSSYPLDLTKYDGDLYVVLGAAIENKLTIYKDPVRALNNNSGPGLAPAQIMHIEAPNYVSFSTTAQLVMAENGTNFSVYDNENDKGYTYTAAQPLDTTTVLPGETAPHATWMDGNRIRYVSGGYAQFFDYDYKNQRKLVLASANYLPVFGPDFKFLYTLTSAADGTGSLTQTSMLTPADQ